MGLAHEKKSYLQEKANLFEIGSVCKENSNLKTFKFKKNKNNAIQEADNATRFQTLTNKLDRIDANSDYEQNLDATACKKGNFA